MAYEIVMPQLSDSMEEGKLISWKIKEGDHVKRGDVIAEVESDKAIMEVQSFRNGVVKNLKVKEGESVPVGTVIVEIEEEESGEKAASEPEKTVTETIHEPKKEPETKPAKIPQQTAKLKTEKEREPQSSKTPPKSASIIDEILGLTSTPAQQMPHVAGEASPKAKAKAAQYGLDIDTLQKAGKLPTPAHEHDVERYRLEHYFTPKALKLLHAYRLDPSLFPPEKKYDSNAVLTYIKANDIPLPKPIDTFQKALIQTVENAAKKPVFHIYDTIDATLMLRHKKHTVTVWLIRLFAEAMMRHEQFRSTFMKDSIVTYPNASISVAVAYENYLYMPVFKDANRMQTDEIQKTLETFEEKAKNGTMRASDMEGSTFGISNLGMTGIKRFDAMINKNDSAIAAIGRGMEGKMSITLTIDHRLINGYQAAEFMQTLKELAKDETLFKVKRGL